MLILLLGKLGVVIVPCGLLNICHILLRRKCDIFLNELVHWKLDAASSIVEPAEVRADGLVEFIQPAWREMEDSRLLTVGLRVEFSKLGRMLYLLGLKCLIFIGWLLGVLRFDDSHKLSFPV